MGHLLDNKRATLTAWFGGRIGTVAVTKRYKCSADIALRHAPRFKQPLAIFRDESILGAADDAASEPQRVRLERHVLCDDKGIGNAKQDDMRKPFGSPPPRRSFFPRARGATMGFEYRPVR